MEGGTTHTFPEYVEDGGEKKKINPSLMSSTLYIIEMNIKEDLGKSVERCSILLYYLHM